MITINLFSAIGLALAAALLLVSLTCLLIAVNRLQLREWEIAVVMGVLAVMYGLLAATVLGL